MKPSTKAACLSLFVFPGVGLLWLKRWTRGLLFLIPALVAMGYITHTIFKVVFAVRQKYERMLETDPSLLNLPDLTAIATKMYADILVELSQYMNALNAAEYFFIACWLCSALSSYFVGIQIEKTSNESTTKSVS